MNKFTIQKAFAISAGAGSGKTYTLSRRFINILLGFDFFIEEAGQEHFYADREKKRADLHQIATITYTEAAALEMKERIFKLINKILIFKELNEDDIDYASIKTAFANLDSEAEEYISERLINAEQEMAEANISTIHGFCLGILRRYSDIAKVDGLLEVLGDDDKNQIFNNVFFKIHNAPEFQEEILYINKYVSLFKSRQLIENYVFNHKFRESFNQYTAGKEREIKELLISTLLEPLSSCIKNANKELEKDQRKKAFEAFVQSFYDFEANKYTVFATECDVPTGLGVKSFPFTDKAKKKLEGVMGYFGKVDSEKEAHFIEIMNSFQKLLDTIKTEYDKELRNVNGIDFDTIIQMAAGIIPRVPTDFRYIMVDEFQDTNATQWGIIEEISKKGANLFVVGDEKQSIYAFQGGEIEVFHSVINEQFKDKPEEMSDNYRSDSRIIEFANELFESIFQIPDLRKSENRQIVNDFSARSQPLYAKSKDAGSISFLVTRENNNNDDMESEAQNLAQFIKSIVEGERHPDITKLIKDKKPAIAVLYDAKSKMLDLKKELQRLGVECKVSTSENYYQKTEITDIFFVLKSLSILKDKKDLQRVTATDKFYITGAMKSSILHCTDKNIYETINANVIPKGLLPWLDKVSTQSIHTLTTSILTESGAYSAYALMENYEQRMANIDKFLSEIIEFEKTHGYDIGRLVDKLEQNIYFSDIEEDEAFYLSSTGGSIELCTIHSTKGLEYPMVILAGSAKQLTSQVSAECVKFNKLLDNKNEHYNLTGFMVDNYEPLSLRLLKEVDKQKHMAEKKRLYYVALTRAAHHFVLSANLKSKKDGVSGIDNSYLKMTLDALCMTKENLFDSDNLPDKYDFIYKDDLTVYPGEKISKDFTVSAPFTPIMFETQETKSATAKKTTELEGDDTAAIRGILVHKVLELFWDDLDNDNRFEKLFIKENITDKTLQNDVKRISRNFQNSDVYQQLCDCDEYIFEFAFEETIDGNLHRGFVDLLIKNTDNDNWEIIDFKSGKERESPEYEDQLKFYKKVLEYKGLNIVECKLCWLG